MSSLIRTIQKRIAKKMGYTRQTSRVVMASGGPRVVPYRKGEGPILDPNGEIFGQHWPQVKAPTNPHEPKPKAPRGSRRGKHRKGFRCQPEAA